jgi:hypothetical protein
MSKTLHEGLDTWLSARERIVGYVDHLGYLFCLECAPGRQRPANRPMRAKDATRDDDACDACGCTIKGAV